MGLRWVVPPGKFVRAFGAVCRVVGSRCGRSALHRGDFSLLVQRKVTKRKHAPEIARHLPDASAFWGLRFATRLLPRRKGTGIPAGSPPGFFPKRTGAWARYTGVSTSKN